jgi:S-(hydroxymethyl)glutathione dehydrogenase/alcohol dehydrogenase
MKTNVAILWKQGQPLSVEKAELEAPRAGEILVEVKAAGVCHSDLHAVRGDCQEKRLVGSLYGSGQPLRDIPRLVALYEEGRLKLDELATRIYSLDQINDALEALASGEGARGIIRW